MKFSPDLTADAAGSATKGWEECVSTLTDVRKQLAATEKALSRANSALSKMGYVAEGEPPSPKERAGKGKNSSKQKKSKSKSSKRRKRPKRRSGKRKTRSQGEELRVSESLH